MRKHVITMIMIMQWLTMFPLHYGYILDHECGIKEDDHEVTIGNNAQP